MKNVLFLFLFNSFWLQGCSTLSIDENSQIEFEIKSSISELQPALSDAHIEVKSFNNVLLITGQVPQQSDKDWITSIIEKKSPRREIHNALEISPNTSLFTRANDTFIASKIKAKFIGSTKIDAEKIVVLVENGVVYLIGIVTKEESDSIISLVENISDIKKIVKVFKYIK